MSLDDVRGILQAQVGGRPLCDIVTPRELAMHVLHARYAHAIDEAGLPDVAGDTVLAPHQLDAVAAVEAIIARYGGAIVADSVGLGKTFIALATIQKAVAAGASVQVIVPAALRADWRRHLERSCGDARASRRVRLLTHTHLSRVAADTVFPAAGLVVVDEAHAFRHADTRRYASLARICAGAQVLLVTATPVSNSVLDFYHLLRLFTGNDAFAHLGVPDLSALFRDVARKEVSLEPVARIVRAVTIRRTRAFLRRHYRDLFMPGGSSMTFPRAAPPLPVRYSLGKDVLRESLRLLDDLRFAAARAARIELSGAGGADLLRFLLLKRLDSSAAAFDATLERQIAFQQRFLDHLSGGHLLTARNDLSRARGADVLQLSLDALVLERLPAGMRADRLQREVRADLDALRALRRVIAPAVRDDPKVAALQQLLLGRLCGQRVLVFTEFRDTARHLWRALAPQGGAALVVGDEARLGLMIATRSAAITRFAPRANHARVPVTREAVRWLIATDVLSEGLNLQDADVVVSYDLPWNPVRLLQRVGRIDRIGSPHEIIHSFHFLPEHGLESMLGLVGRLARKAETIRKTLGEEESLAGLSRAGELFVRLNRADPGAFDLAERDALLDADAWERCRLLYLDALRDGWRPHAADTDAPCLAAAITDASQTQTCALVLTDGHACAIGSGGRVMAAATAPQVDAMLASCVETDPQLLEPELPVIAAGLEVGRARIRRASRRVVLGPAFPPRALLRVRKLAARLPLDAQQCARFDRLTLAARSSGAGVEEAFERAWIASGIAVAAGLPELSRFLDEAEASLLARRRSDSQGIEIGRAGTIAILEIRAPAPFG